MVRYMTTRWFVLVVMILVIALSWMIGCDGGGVGPDIPSGPGTAFPKVPINQALNDFIQQTGMPVTGVTVTVAPTVTEDNYDEKLCAVMDASRWTTLPFPDPFQVWTTEQAVPDEGARLDFEDRYRDFLRQEVMRPGHRLYTVTWSLPDGSAVNTLAVTDANGNLRFEPIVWFLWVNASVQSAGACPATQTRQNIVGWTVIELSVDINVVGNQTEGCSCTANPSAWSAGLISHTTPTTQCVCGGDTCTGSATSTFSLNIGTQWIGITLQTETITASCSKECPTGTGGGTK